MEPDPSCVLYGYAGSGSAAVEAALELAGQRYRRVDAATWDEASALDELRSINRLQQIPALRWPDGSVMSESAAILIELGLRHPASGLLPTEPAARAQSMRGLVYIVANCYAAIGIIDYPERWCSPAEPVHCDAVKAGARQRLHALWEVFADSFQATPWLAGDRMGALDLLAAVVSKWSGARAHLQARRPDFAALMQRVDAHPVVAPVFARHWPG